MRARIGGLRANASRQSHAELDAAEELDAGDPAELGRDTADTSSTAPAMPDGDWQAYGRTEFGDRYSPLKQITPANVGKLQEA